MPRDSHGKPQQPAQKEAPVVPEVKTPEPVAEKKRVEPSYARKRH